MAIELKQTLKLSQQLLITPQLQQAIKLLQLSRMELIETIQKELLENPVLEELDEAKDAEAAKEKVQGPEAEHEVPSVVVPVEAADQSGQAPTDPGTKDFDWASYIEASSHYGREGRNFAENLDEIPNYENMLASPTTLKDHLEWQINMGSLSAEEEELCLDLIGSLDDNGYLKVSLEELSEKIGHTVDALEDALCVIQDLDPPGVGARDLRECLLLQVKEMGTDKHVLEQIIKNYLDHVEKRNYQALGRKLKLMPRKAKELMDTILSLEPKPGRAFERGESIYIVPDVYVQKVGDEYVVVLNEDGLPKLQISQFYRNMLLKELSAKEHAVETNTEAPTGDSAQNYIQDKLKSALWLIKSIHQRQRTLYKVTKSIALFQKDFMDQGVQSLKPLVLRDVADDIGVHESTVSRATNGKYVHTPQGIFELKYFFNTGLANTDGGEEFANEAVKQMIKQIIGVETPKTPLSDQAIAAILKNQNVNIARRTVAKYREMLGILPSSRRRKMS